MLNYIATVVALSVPVSWTCVRLAAPLLGGENRISRHSMGAASVVSSVICIVTALWAATGRVRTPAASIAVASAITSAVLIDSVRRADTMAFLRSILPQAGTSPEVVKAPQAGKRASRRRAANREVHHIIPAEVAAIEAPEHVQNQLDMVMSLLCSSDAVRDPEERRQLVEMQRRLHALQNAHITAGNSGLDQASVAECYAKHAEKINALLGRELTDDSNT